MRAPEFWDRRDRRSRLAVAALAPIGWIYSASVAWKAHGTTPYRPDVPVVCVGNLTVGGSGKTPVAIAIARALLARGRRPLADDHLGADLERLDLVADRQVHPALELPGIAA